MKVISYIWMYLDKVPQYVEESHPNIRNNFHWDNLRKTKLDVHYPKLFQYQWNNLYYKIRIRIRIRIILPYIILLTFSSFVIFIIITITIIIILIFKMILRRTFNNITTIIPKSSKKSK